MNKEDTKYQKEIANMESVRDYWTMKAMEEYGDSFVKALVGVAWRADQQNLAKIKHIWNEYWTEYDKMGQKLEKEYDAGSK